jgi:hypothetical protein
VTPWTSYALKPVIGRLRPSSLDLPWITACLAVLATLRYLWLRVVATQFYAPLGLSVEDVGLDQTAILTRSAAGVFFIAVLYGALWLALTGGFAFALVTGLEEALHSFNWRLAVIVTQAFLICLGPFLLGLWLIASGGELAYFGGALFGYSSVMWLLGIALGIPLGSALQNSPRMLLGLALLMCVLLLGYGLYTLTLIARGDSRAVLSGKAPYTEFEGVSLMPYRVQIAYVALDETKRGEQTRCVLYLGEAERRVIVYDGVAERMRLLRGDAEVAIVPGGRRCPSGSGRLVNRRARASRDGYVRLRATCGHTTMRCARKLIISTPSGAGEGRAGRGRSAALVIARDPLVLPARTTKTITVKLNPAGKRLLRRRRELDATAVIGASRRPLTILPQDSTE